MRAKPPFELEASSIYLGPLVSKVKLPRNVQKAKILMAALPPALPHFLQEAFPDFLCPKCPYVRLCTLLPDICVCVLPTPPRLTFRHELNLVLLCTPQPSLAWSVHQ